MELPRRDMSRLTNREIPAPDRAIDVLLRDGGGRTIAETYFGAGDALSLVSDANFWGPMPLEPVVDVVDRIVGRVAGEDVSVFVHETTESEIELNARELPRELMSALGPLRLPADMPVLVPDDLDRGDQPPSEMAPAAESVHLNRLQLSALADNRSQQLPADWGAALFSPLKTLTFGLVSAQREIRINVNSTKTTDLRWTPSRSGLDLCPVEPSSVFSAVSDELAAVISSSPANVQAQTETRAIAPDPDSAEVAIYVSSLERTATGMIVGMSADGFVDAEGRAWTLATVTEGAEFYEPTTTAELLGIISNHFGPDDAQA